MFDLTGKCALVTGASGGIGGAIARAFHARGAKVGLSGTRIDALEALAQDLGDGSCVVPADLAETIAGELRENLDNFGYRSKRDFSGHDTNRCHHVLEEAPSSVALISHDMIMDVADAILLPHCESYRPLPY